MSSKRFINLVILLLIAIFVAILLLYKFLPPNIITNNFKEGTLVSDVYCTLPVKISGNSMEPFFSPGEKTNFNRCFEMKDIMRNTFIMYKENSTNRIAIVDSVLSDQVIVYQPNRQEDNRNNVKFEDIVAIYTRNQLDLDVGEEV